MDEDKVSFLQKFLDFLGQDEQEEQIEKEDKEEMEQNFNKSFEITKEDDEKQIVTGVVLKANKADLEGDFFGADVVEKMAFDFMKQSQTIGFGHEQVLKDAYIVESFIAPESFSLGSGKVEKSDWVVSVKIENEELWKAVKKGKIKSFSIGGLARKVPLDE